LHNKTRQNFKEEKLQLDADDLPPIYVMHDHVRLYSASEAYRLLKVRAEIRLCHAIIIGLLLIPIVNLICWIYYHESLLNDRAVFELIILIFIFAFWSVLNKFYSNYISGICRAWLMISYPYGPFKEYQNKMLENK